MSQDEPAWGEGGGWRIFWPKAKCNSEIPEYIISLLTARQSGLKQADPELSESQWVASHGSVECALPTHRSHHFEKSSARTTIKILAAGPSKPGALHSSKTIPLLLGGRCLHI
jgi:hypothetical protein